MLATDRIYLVQNHINGQQSWFFKAREGDFGPYETMQQAESKLKQFVHDCANSNQAGRRLGQFQSNSALLQMQDTLLEMR